MALQTVSLAQNWPGLACPYFPSQGLLTWLPSPRGAYGGHLPGAVGGRVGGRTTSHSRAPGSLALRIPHLLKILEGNK